jgi:hypothetical protein
MRCTILLLSALLLPATTGATAAEGPRASYNGCGSPQLQHRAEPSPGGPARLVRFDCLQLPHTRLSYEPPVISPDGRRFLVYGYTMGVVAGTLESGAADISHSFDPTFVQFTGLTFARSGFFFRWASDSRSVWAADQKTGPGHFAAGPLEPVLIGPDGSEHTVPPLAVRAGPLDGLQWIGGDGLALAQFGTRGGYYRPEHSDPEPMLAFVDLKRGRFLDWISLKNIPKAVTAQGRPMVPLTISAVQLPNGRPSAVFQWPSGFSMVWASGSKPSEIKLPKLVWGARVALAPDGKRLLISHPLSAAGMICEIWDRNSSCPPPTPVSGRFAELVDIETGKTIWQNSGTAKQFEGYPEPVVSPDGRYALVGIPHRNGNNIALVSMRDGQILQTVPSTWSTWSVDFGADSRRFFVSGGNFVATYELAETKRN